MPSSGGIFHRKCLKATAGFWRKHRLTKIKMKEPQARITRPPTHLFFMTHSCPNLYCKEKSTTRRISDLCSTPRWTKRLRGVLTHSRTHKWKTQICFDNLLYYKNIYECKLQQSASIFQEHTHPASDCFHVGKVRIPLQITCPRAKGGHKREASGFPLSGLLIMSFFSQNTLIFHIPC